MLNRLKARLPISRRFRRVLKRWRLAAFTRVGSDRFAWTALGDLDHKLVELVDGRQDGRFLEVGANDGLQQSNTFALERLFGWRGVLVEANPELAAECGRNRPAAITVCAALGSQGGLVHVDGTSDLLGRVGGVTNSAVACTTMSSVIDFTRAAPLDLISIDVEGFELEVLAGLDLERHGPTILLIETSAVDKVTAAVQPWYELIATWSHHDYVFRRTTS